MLLKALMRLPRSAIFAIINDFDKTVSISYTTNLQQRLGLISSDYLQRNISMENLEEKILETHADSVLVKYYMDDYRNKGYTVIGTKIPLEYRFKVELSIVDGNVKVIAANKRNDKITLGTFESVGMAEDFLSYITRNNLSKNLIYSIYR